MSAYQTAVLKPPHLSALLLWEGISDIYREVNTTGGIPNVAFQSMWMNMTGNGLGESEDHAVACLEHPLYDSWWQSKVVDWSQITIPAFSVTGWSSLGLHLRGTIEAWKQFSSSRKYIFIHAGREWSEYYKDENVRKQKLFWDRFLKDDTNEVDNWPVATYDIRVTLDNVHRHSEDRFPPKAKITPFRLTATGLSTDERHSSEPAYQSYISHSPGSSVKFDYRIDQTTEITGYASVKLFVQSLQYPDADIYVALQKIGKDGKEIKFWHSSQQVEASASFGWLRASHRELDPQKSLPERPYHLHRRRQWLRPADIVELQIELWPSSTGWSAGEVLRLVVQGVPFTGQQNITQVKGPTHGFGEAAKSFTSRQSGL
ncbi:hypothetical protein Plec18167_003678 [Paecilomyces lecythidis]|uniref:Xaa-Pro dipeptidyl-peptidase C-terminal domain-containing protein n=1 Tax=Paecilomyces lecythidis TaxID=3004212 RepID=A0ABR3XX55_9EURO